MARCSGPSCVRAQAQKRFDSRIVSNNQFNNTLKAAHKPVKKEQAIQQVRCQELGDSHISYETYLRFLTGPWSMMLVMASVQHAEQLVEVRFSSILARCASLSRYSLAAGPVQCHA